MITIIDYGAGNLANVKNALDYLNIQSQITADPDKILKAAKIILPGVGAFSPAMEKLNASGISDAVISRAKDGRPILGICLGMQMLFTYSEEDGRHSGLNIIPGSVKRFKPGVKIPHVGWNSLDFTNTNNAITGGVDNCSYVYFVHGFKCDPDDGNDVIAWTEYGDRFASIVSRDNIYGMQFHPEKSQKSGLRLLKNFGDL
jgi:glutamine amidotransferase